MQNTIWRESEGKIRKIFAHLVSGSNVSNVSREVMVMAVMRL